MSENKPWRPTKAELAAAAESGYVPDIIGAALRVLFCGINPGLYSGAVRHHFARPGNRFWPTLHRAGFTPELLSPFGERRLLDWGIGITNIAPRTTATAAELTDAELRAGAQQLEAKVLQYRPRWLAVLGVDAYRRAFSDPAATVGQQHRRIGETRVWVLPNPSGLNAHYQLDRLVEEFSRFRAIIG